MPESHLDRLVEAIEREERAVFAEPDARGRLRLAEYRGERFDPPLLLDFTEAEFDAAVRAAVRAAGRDGRTPWPEVPEPEGGFRLLLVHLDESLSKERRPRSRISLDDGQIWAE